MIKLIICDLCGVVFHCEEPPFFRYFSETYGIPIEKVETIYSQFMVKAELGKYSAYQALDFFLRYFNIKLSSGELLRKLISFKKFNAGTVSLLQKLKGKYNLAYLTNSSAELMQLSEERLPIFQVFDYGFISAAIKVRKPDPKGFQLLLDHFHAKPEEAIFIDDGMKNVVNAKAMGIHTIHFQSSSQLEIELKKIIKIEK